MRSAFELVGLALSLVGLVLGSWPLLTGSEPPTILLASFLCGLATVALVLCFMLLRQLAAARAKGSREARWSVALPKISQAVLHLADSVTSNASVGPTGDMRDFQSHAQQACNALSSAFTQVVGRDCRVTLKETFAPEAGSGHQGDVAGPSDTAVKQLFTTGPPSNATQAVDWVSENTDFDEVFSGANYFFCNDLPAEVSKGYKNSHWGRAQLKRMVQENSFPYRSTIVWPVRARLDAQDGEPSWNTVGFLCVDSAEADAFDARLDVIYGEIVAQAFYTVWPRTPVAIDTHLPEEQTP